MPFAIRISGGLADTPAREQLLFRSCALLSGPLTTGFWPGSTIASPPAFSIFSRADLLKRWAEIFSFLVSSPSPRIFSSS